jgi:hypothetical protein
MGTTEEAVSKYLGTVNCEGVMDRAVALRGYMLRSISDRVGLHDGALAAHMVCSAMHCAFREGPPKQSIHNRKSNRIMS